VVINEAPGCGYFQTIAVTGIEALINAVFNLMAEDLLIID